MIRIYLFEATIKMFHFIFGYIQDTDLYPGNNDN